MFDDLKQQIELTHHRVREDALTTTTRVHAEVTSLVGEDSAAHRQAAARVADLEKPAGQR